MEIRVLRRPTGWRRPIRCHQLQVIFRKSATNYRALLRKMTYEDKASYGSFVRCTHTTQRALQHIATCWKRASKKKVEFCFVTRGECDKHQVVCNEIYMN